MNFTASTDDSKVEEPLMMGGVPLI